MASAAWPSTVQQNSQTTVFSFRPTSPLPLFPTNLRFPSRSRTVPVPVRQFKSSNFSYNAVAQDQTEEEEDPVIGDCLVFEEGVFDDLFLSTPRNFNENGGGVSGKDRGVSPESLIPDNWLDVQREINITKKERRKLSQQLEYGRSLEKRRQALRPVNSDNYEKLRQEKLEQLKPIVLDNPEPKYLEENDKHVKADSQKNGEGITVTGRVAPRNPRLAVYGVGLEDISDLFKSGSYEPGSRDKGQAGNRKSFSKEEKLLMNRRVPNLAVATSGKWHPLHSLATSGEFYLVNSLLQHYPDINAPDKDGLTALHKSILGKKQAIFNFLLRESANPFVRDNDEATLMHYAVFAASSQMIKILLLYNVDINLQDNDGWTPLHLAVQSRRTDIARLLLIKGADKTLKNQDGLTALELCLYSGRDTRTYELIKLLKRLP